MINYIVKPIQLSSLIQTVCLLSFLQHLLYSLQCLHFQKVLLYRSYLVDRQYVFEFCVTKLVKTLVQECVYVLPKHNGAAIEQLRQVNDDFVHFPFPGLVQ